MKNALTNTTGSLQELLKEAWQIRQASFPPSIGFVVPLRTLAVSTTGENCDLKCAHCGGHYLKGMIPLEEALCRKRGKEKSFLVSGGCNRQGKIPYFDRWEEIERLSLRGSLNFHAGLVSEKEARQLGTVSKAVSFDFMTSRKTIQEIYGLNFDTEDYILSFRYLQRYNRTVPHLCLGLGGNPISAEYRALHILQPEKPVAITFIVFRPTPGTALASCAPPDLLEVVRFLATARIMFPRTPLFLGCLRPGGEYRKSLDSYAVLAGINKIVLPAPAARLQAEELELALINEEECCSL